MKCYTRMPLILLAIAAATTSGQQLNDDQRNAIRSACRSDYMKVCSSVPSGTKQSLQCLLQHDQELSGACQTALAPARSTTLSSAANAPAATAAASAPATAAISATPHSPREEAAVIRANCRDDFHKLCANVALGGGRAASCLRAHVSELTPACRSSLSAAAPK